MKNFKEFYIIIILSTIIILLFINCKKNKNTDNIKKYQENLKEHPVYKKYNFTESDKIIKFGVQPVYLPTCLFIEAMKHDRILISQLKKSGKEIKYYSFLKGSDVNYFLINNYIDIGIGGDMPAIYAANYSDIIIPMMMQSGNVSIVTRDVVLLKSLKGKRIGYAFGSNAHYMLLNALKFEGISEKDVKLIPLNVNQMPEYLYRKKIYAFSSWEPYVESTLKKYPGYSAIYKDISTGYIYFKKDFITKNKESSYQITASLIRAFNWMKSDYNNVLKASSWAITEAEKFTGEKSNITIEQYAALAMKDILSKNSILDCIITNDNLKKPGKIYKEYDLLKKINKIPPNSDWKKIENSFDRYIIQEILKKSDFYKLKKYNYSE